MTMVLSIVIKEMADTKHSFLWNQRLIMGNFSWNYSIVGLLLHLIVITPQNLVLFLNAKSFPSSET